MIGEIKPTIPLISPEDLFAKSNLNIIPITLMKWTVKGSLCYLITGDQGSGKTTTFKSIIRYYPPWAALRVNELQPEMHLRYAYPQKNIMSFCETAYIKTQDGLNFQKKTSGTYNLIGEIASAEAACWWVQTCKVASKAGAGTHHGKTAYDTVTALAQNLMSIDNISDMQAAERRVADALDIDIHMDRVDKLRYCERITQITPIKTQKYPYPNPEEIFANKNLAEGEKKEQFEKARKINQNEFFKRITDRETFVTTNLCEYDKEAGRYVLKNFFSDAYINTILKNLNKEMKEEFLRDMDMLDEIRKTIPRIL